MQPLAESGNRRHHASVLSVGYEGREIGEFVRDLQARDVTVLADVRLNAVSRRQGFSKTALRTASETAGIRYVHLRCLGNPAFNRAAFSGTEVETGRALFRQLLDGEAARRDLATLHALASDATVAILCVERDEVNCHRSVVIEALCDYAIDSSRSHRFGG